MAYLVFLSHQNQDKMSKKKPKDILTHEDLNIAFLVKGPSHFLNRFYEEEIPIPQAIDANISIACSIINLMKGQIIEGPSHVDGFRYGSVAMIWLELERRGYVKPEWVQSWDVLEKIKTASHE